jgi:Flp pilus assembly protein TadG
MNMWRKTFGGQRNPRGEEGQSLLETAFSVPLLMGIAFNLINLGYFWFMLLALSAAARQGAQFATQGGAAGTGVSAPGTTAVSNLVYENMTNAIYGATTSNAAVRVCTSAKGVSGTGSSQVAQCDTFGPSFSYSAITSDPEAPTFVLDRLDVEYTVTPVIPGSAFNVILPSNLQFARHISMRSLY